MKRKLTKRVFSLLLTLALLCTLLPQISGPANAAYDNSGTCGDNLTWTFDPDTGLLTIEGSGPMDDYLYSGQPLPWSDYLYQITALSLPEGLTHVGDGAFVECSNLNELVIPRGVESIGDQAFMDCYGLTKVTISETVSSIGAQAFQNCSSVSAYIVAEGSPYYCSDRTGVLFTKDMTKLVRFPSAYQTAYVIPDTVTEIGENAFQLGRLTGITFPDNGIYIGEGAFALCRGLTTLTIPDSAALGYCPFGQCSGLTTVELGNCTADITPSTFENCVCLMKFIAAETNERYSTDEAGVLYDKGKTELLLVPQGIPGNYEIPDSVTKIGFLAFRACFRLKSVTIPASVTSIEDYAFAECGSALVIRGVPGSEAERYANENNILFLSLDSKWEGFCGGDGDGSNLGWFFDAATGVLTIEGSGSMGNYMYIGSPWEMYSDEITALSLPAGLTTIGDSAFWKCANLTDFTIPDGVVRIGDSAFSTCAGPEALTIPGSVENIGNFAFDSCTGLKRVSIPESVTGIGLLAFRGCNSLTAITVASDNPSYCSDAAGILFNKDKTELICCPGGFVGTYTVPESVVMIDTDAFMRCTGLREIHFPDNGIQTGEYCFVGCSGLTELTIPDSMQIGFCAFSDCIGLTSVYLGNCASQISGYTFGGCSSLTAFHVAETNEIYSTDEKGVLFNKDKSLLISCPGGFVGAYAIPDDVQSLGYSAFDGCAGLSGVTFPDSLTSIPFAAFRGCVGLTRLVLPANLTNIEDQAFLGCTGLPGVVIPETVTDMGYNNDVFDGCVEGFIIFGKPNTAAHQYAMTNASIRFVELGGFETHGYCGGEEDYTKLTFDLDPASGVLTFEGSGEMEEYSTMLPIWYGLSGFIYDVSLPNGLTNIGASAFLSCSKLTEITIPDSVTKIGGSAFCQCAGLKRIQIPDGVKTIGNCAFAECESLTQADLGSGLETIEELAFFRCGALKSVKIPNSVTQIGSNAFSTCTSLVNVVIGSGLTSIEPNTFINCTALNNVIIPETVTSIGENAFGYYYDENNGTVPIPGFTIIGETGSEAERYALDNGFLFVPIVRFSDVSDTAYYANSVDWAVANGITGGTGNGKFSPKKTCTREQVVTFLYAAAGKPEYTQSEIPFTDVKEGKYYRSAVMWAVENKVTGGVSDMLFGVGKPCTREQVVTFLWKAAGSPAPESTESSFSDVQPGKYYYKAVLWASENGITGGVGDGKFGVGKPCTRAQIVTFLYIAVCKI